MRVTRPWRGAAISSRAARGADTLGTGSRSASGPRFLVYSGLSLPAGRSSLSLYAYDRYRLRPHGYDSTVVQVPRGNVLALVGWLVRPGLDVRYRASAAWTVLVQGQVAFGRVADNGSSVPLVGPRAVVLLEWAR